MKRPAANPHQPSPARDTAGELAALRAEVRRAHEAIQELKDLQRIARAMRDQINQEWHHHQLTYAERVQETIAQGVQITLAGATEEIARNLADTRDKIDEAVRRQIDQWFREVWTAARGIGLPVSEPESDLILLGPSRMAISLTPVSDEVASFLNAELEERRRTDGGTG